MHFVLNHHDHQTYTIAIFAIKYNVLCMWRHKKHLLYISDKGVSYNCLVLLNVSLYKATQEMKYYW
jgi:hypothetical protein